ncbi:hypothetical protein VTI74DRAFT_7718 [Chaetomium olivicolor]
MGAQQWAWGKSLSEPLGKSKTEIGQLVDVIYSLPVFAVSGDDAFLGLRKTTCQPGRKGGQPQTQTVMGLNGDGGVLNCYRDTAELLDLTCSRGQDKNTTTARQPDGTESKDKGQNHILGYRAACGTWLSRGGGKHRHGSRSGVPLPRRANHLQTGRTSTRADCLVMLRLSRATTRQGQPQTGQRGYLPGTYPSSAGWTPGRGAGSLPPSHWPPIACISHVVGASTAPDSVPILEGQAGLSKLLEAQKLSCAVLRRVSSRQLRIRISPSPTFHPLPTATVVIIAFQTSTVRRSLSTSPPPCGSV